MSAKPRAITPSAFEPDGDVIDAVEALKDIAISHHQDIAADEVFEECRLCGEWDSHADNCPMPAILKWQES